MTQQNDNITLPGSQTPDIGSLMQRIDALERKVNGSINLSTDITGLFEVVSSVPSGKPKSPYEQIKIYENGGTHQLYWYDYINDAWRHN